MTLSNIQINPKFREIVTTAARRVVLSKLNYFKGGNAAPLYPEIARLKEQIPDKEGQKFFLSQACRSITVYKRGTLPLQNNNAGKILIVGPNDTIQGGESAFFAEAKKRYAGADSYKINFEGLGPIGIDWKSA